MPNKCLVWSIWNCSFQNELKVPRHDHQRCSDAFGTMQHDEQRNPSACLIYISVGMIDSATAMLRRQAGDRQSRPWHYTRFGDLFDNLLGTNIIALTSIGR